MRDWSTAFRRASFRGVGFWVDEDGPEKGRRVAVNDISGGNVPVVEDMGRLAARFTITAYIVSDTADADGRRLEDACEADGGSILRLPMDPAFRVMCEGCRRSRRKDRNGYIAYDLAFVVAGGRAVVEASTQSQMRSAFERDMAQIATALAEAFR